VSESRSEPPVFVLGPPRSGTTLTGRILGAHRRIFVPAERNFFERIYARLPAEGDWQERYLPQMRKYWLDGNSDPEHKRIVAEAYGQPEFEERLRRAPDVATFFGIFMAAQAAAAGKPRWCTQTHNDVFHIPSIFALYPDAKVVISVRHPLDFLVSYRDKWRRAIRRNRGADAAQRLRQLYHPVVTSMFWLMNVRAISRALAAHPNSVLLVRYEDLVRDPEATSRRLCAFLGEEFDPAMLRPGFNNSSLDIQSGEIFSTSVDRWKGSLSASEAFVAQRLCRRAMRKFGYAPVQLSAPPLQVLWHFATAPVSALQGLANVQRGPLLPYVAKRIGLLLFARTRRQPDVS
jgi:hypothetical protein